MATILFVFTSLANSFVATRLIQAFLKYRVPSSRPDLATSHDRLPSVSVLIPARNEQSAMRKCIERVMASNYPKMEVIVLDDNSVDNTSKEVKNFAHSGVRFVKGEEPPEGWLGRNYAYKRLSEEASGDYLIFLSVDTNIDYFTISYIVDYILRSNVEMMSVLPTRRDNYRASVLFSTLRYYLELILARSNHPPSSSSAWVINRDILLDNLGGMNSFRQSIMPEADIAKKISLDDGNIFKIDKPKYNFLIDEGKIGVSFEKRWSSQLQTQQRNYALRIFKSPIFIFYALMIFGLQISSIAFILLKVLLVEFDTIFWCFLIQLLLSMVSYGLYASLVWSKGSWAGFIFYPIILIQEFMIFLSAIWRRFFGKIIWRGREINFRDF